MDDMYILTTFVGLDDGLEQMGYRDDPRARVATSEILLVAVIAARYFHNHLQLALSTLIERGDIRPLSFSRFCRRLHQAQAALHTLLETLIGQRPRQVGYCIDTFPLPVCQHVRRNRCHKVSGDGYRGYCPAKSDWFFGFRLHWVCDFDGFPVSFDLLPAVCHELTPLQYLVCPIPNGSRILADGAYLSKQESTWIKQDRHITLVVQRHARLKVANTADERAWLRQFRRRIETAHSRLEAMGIQRLRAVTLDGFLLKVIASLFALATSILFP
jgi:hypothetical protein